MTDEELSSYGCLGTLLPYPHHVHALIPLQLDLQHLEAWSLQLVSVHAISRPCLDTYRWFRKDEDYRWAILRAKMPPWLFQVFNFVFIGKR